MFKKRGCLSKIPRATKILFCGRGIKLISPLRGTNKTNISYHISFSRFSILNVITKAPAVYPLMVNTLNVPGLLF